MIQSYSWTYPNIICSIDVPITTPGRATQASNLTCVVDCTTDGGYSTKPIATLTDCTSLSSSLGMMNSERSVNITLAAGAHFYVAYVGSAWVALSNPAVSGRQWSIVCSIDLRQRPDGFINTPPVSNVISPQYAIVNRTTQIRIPVSDANSGDTVRCRWSVYTPGYGKRKRSDEVNLHSYRYTQQALEKSFYHDEIIRNRNKRTLRSCSQAVCRKSCSEDCPCNCSGCLGTDCTNTSCTKSMCTNSLTTKITSPTTSETPGTIPSTISYPIRQAIDECGGICYPGSLPNGTSLSNCTLSFRGLVPNTWYAAAIQVND